MNKILVSSFIGAMLVITTPSTSAMTGEVSTITTTTVTDISKIQDPYEQCLAYTKLKNITDVDCKAKVDTLKKKQEQKMQAEENDRQKDMKVIATAWKKPDNTTNGNIPKPSMPPVNIDALMDHYMKAIDDSGVQLTAEQRTKIMEALRIQFSKVEISSKLKDIKQETKKEIKEMRTTQKSDIKSKQEAMRKLLKEKKDAMKNKNTTRTTNQ